MAENRVNVGSTSVHGRVATAPELNHTAEGKPVVSFRLAENKRYKDRQTGEWKNSDPEYYDVGITREQLGKNVLSSLETGQLVNVEGNQVIRGYTTRDGEARVGRSIYATDVSPSLQLDSLQRGPSSDVDLSPEAAGPEATQQVETDPAAGVDHQQAEQQVVANHVAQNSGQVPSQQPVPTGPEAPSDVWQDPAFVQRQAQQTAANFQQHQSGPGM